MSSFGFVRPFNCVEIHGDDNAWLNTPHIWDFKVNYIHTYIYTFEIRFVLYHPFIALTLVLLYSG